MRKDEQTSKTESQLADVQELLDAFQDLGTKLEDRIKVLENLKRDIEELTANGVDKASPHMATMKGLQVCTA